MLRVLTWNLYHGRTKPETPRALQTEFAALLSSWEWDVALLQEVPSWWPPELARAAGATAFTVRTSRNQLQPVSRWIAEHRPDVIKSWDGGANTILVRGHGVTEHRRLRLRLWRERRFMHAVRRDDGVWFGNLHATAHDVTKAQADLDRSAATLRGWAGAEPAVIGGDMNTKTPAFPGFEHHCGGHVLDHVFATGIACAGPIRRLERDGLSDHVPVLATLSAET